MNDLTDADLLRIWTRQAYEMGLIDNKIPIKRVGAHGLTLAERNRIRAKCDLMGCPDPFVSFRAQRENAAKRGIEWEMNFLEWWGLWEPYYAQRGHGGRGLEMCRVNDSGPYKIGNVFIASGLENRELTRGRPRPKSRR